MNMDGLTPIERRSFDKEQRYSYKCVSCGGDATNGYFGKENEPMLENRECYTCNYWRNFEKNTNLEKSTIINGRTYSPGNRTSGSMRGMAGRRFDIEYINPSVHSGKKITTFDLWAGGEIPDHLKDKFPDTAKFLNDAVEAKLSGEIKTCWNPSSTKNEPHPLPRSIGII